MTTITTTTIPDLVTGGTLAHADGIVYILTTCCGASAKGVEYGAACRKCYTPISDLFGMAWTADEFADNYPEWVRAHSTLTEAAKAAPGVLTYTRMISADLGIAK
jgi:hypothetical protein